MASNVHSEGKLMDLPNCTKNNESQRCCDCAYATVEIKNFLVVNP
jgi:hypothetical protein